MYKSIKELKKVLTNIKKCDIIVVENKKGMCEMKTYGNGYSATEFTAKQVNVIYGKAKAGDLKIEKWLMSNIYDMAGFYGIDWSKTAELEEKRIMDILEAVFKNDMDQAQKCVDIYTDMQWNRLSLKRQREIDRTLYV